MKDLSDKPKTKHKHADLIIAWANDPSLEIQILKHGEWHTLSNPSWLESEQYRIKPETININGIEVPKPESLSLHHGGRYYSPKLSSKYLVHCYTWENDYTDRLFLNYGMVHLTKEAALQHAKALILASGGAVNE